MNEIHDNLRAVKERIASAARKASRDPASVTLVAVSKLKPAADIREALTVGQEDFGENYVQELLKKRDDLGEEKIRWHFVGHLQSRKVRDLVGIVSLIHSLDSLKLAREIDKAASAAEVVQRALLQVNLSFEATKSGIGPEEAAPFLRAAANLKNLEITGLMTLPPPFEDPEKSRPFFKRLFSLREKINGEKTSSHRLTELSMGMSHDFEVAIEEGATIVRIGTSLFGKRK